MEIVPKQCVTVSHGISGYYAVVMAWNPEHGGFWEPASTGVGRYSDRVKAEDEAKFIADDNDLEYRGQDIR